MFRPDALEAAPMVNATLEALLARVATRGRTGSDVRSAINKVRANVLALLQKDAIGPPLLDCFETARLAGVTFKIMESVRVVAASYAPTLVGAIVMRDSLIQFCLATQARIIASTDFVSRQDVEETRLTINASFNSVEEDVADRMDAMTFRAIIELHAAISYYLVETARPLPRILNYRFNQPLSTIAMAQRLYHDAGRADELLKENRIVHPAFAPLTGLALSN
jgi:prophage DNA circulation protein